VHECITICDSCVAVWLCESGLAEALSSFKMVRGDIANPHLREILYGIQWDHNGLTEPPGSFLLLSMSMSMSSSVTGTNLATDHDSVAFKQILHASIARRLEPHSTTITTQWGLPELVVFRRKPQAQSRRSRPQESLPHRPHNSGSSREFLITNSTCNNSGALGG